MKNQINISGLFKCAVLAGAAILAPVATFGVPITFDLRNTTAAVEIESGTIERGGIKASLSPAVVGRIGQLNQNGSGFGIDVVGVGGEVANQLDGGLGGESISILFDVDVTWISLAVSSFGSSDQARLTIGSFSPFTITGGRSWSADNFVAAGNAVVLSYVAGNGFSFDSFVVEKWTPPVATPDSGSPIVLLGIALGGLGFIVRRRSAQPNTFVC